MSVNAGTPLSEDIRIRNQKEMAYHMLNIASASGMMQKILIDPGAEYGPQEDGFYNIRHAELGNLERISGINMSLTEEFFPSYDAGRLLYMKWKENSLELKSNDLVLFRYGKPFDLLSKHGEIILIRMNGELLYLKEVDWLPVQSLAGYTISDEFSWINNDEIIAFVEKDSTGVRYVVKASIGGKDAEFFPCADGILLDLAAGNDAKDVFCLNRVGEEYVLFRYLRAKGVWVSRGEFAKRVYLLCVRGGRPVIWDGSDKINNQGENDISGIEVEQLDLYPYGGYLFGPRGGRLEKNTAGKKYVLFYRRNQRGNLRKTGLNKIEIFSSNPEILTVYYDTVKETTREIGFVEISLPAIKWKLFVYIGLTVLGMLVVMIYIFRKKK
jgi:hypothetical protein